MREILHKSTTARVSTLPASRVQTVTVGDGWDPQQQVDYGPAATPRSPQMCPVSSR